MAFDPRGGSVEIPPQFRPTEESLRLGEAFGSLGFADADVLVQEPAVVATEDAPLTPDSDDTDIHGNDTAAVGAVTDHARKLDDTIAGYVHLANVTGGDVNQSLIISDGRLAQGGDGGDARNRRDQRRAQQQVTDQMLLAQMEYHQQMADQIGDYLAEGNFAVGADGRLENEEMEQQLREYERRNGLPEGSIDRHDAAAVRDALEDQEEWHRTQAAEAGQEIRQRQGIAADVRSGVSAADAVAGQSDEAVFDAARQLAQDSAEDAREVYEAAGISEDEVDLNVEIAADGGFGSILAENPPDLASLTIPDFEDQPQTDQVAAAPVAEDGERSIDPADGERSGPVITPAFTVASVGEGSEPAVPAPPESDAPPPFPGFS